MARRSWQEWVKRAGESTGYFRREFGVRPLVRMVFYDLTKDGLPNTAYAYKYLDRLLVKARLQKEIPWDGFAEDEARTPAGGDWLYLPPDAAVQGALDCLWDLPERYRLPVWSGQKEQVVVMVEKTGERDVFASLTADRGVLVIPCRGYGAWGSLKALTARLDARPLTVLYFGDFDPSGEDIPRFAREALETLGVAIKEFTKLAVTREQIERFGLPHRPDDEKEIRKLERNPLYKKWPHGLYRVELEALLGVAPDYIRHLVNQAIATRFDQDQGGRAEAEQARLQEEVRQRVDELRRRMGI